MNQVIYKAHLLIWNLPYPIQIVPQSIVVHPEQSGHAPHVSWQRTFTSPRPLSLHSPRLFKYSHLAVDSLSLQLGISEVEKPNVRISS